MDKIKSKLSFINYKVKEVVLKQNENFQNSGNPINIEFELGHRTDIKDNTMKIDLIIDIFKDAEEKNYPFKMKVVLGGTFRVEGDDIKVFEMNAIAILYPYVRAIVSTYTSNSNMPTLILPPINVSNYFKSKEN